MLRRRFLFAKVYEEKPVYKYTYTTTDGLMLDLKGVQNHKYENGVGSFETYSKNCISFKYLYTLESIVIPKGITSIGSDAFYGCSGLTSVIIPNSVTSIGDHAFRNCTSLTSIEIPNSVTSIGDHAFNGCNGLTNIEISNNVKSIGNNVFDGCSELINVVIPNSVTSIGYRAFRGCTRLTSVTIGNSVEVIGNLAFYECTRLKTVYNFSNLTFSRYSNNNGYIAYYANKVINAPKAVIDGDFIWCNLNGVNTLACYLGEVAELNLPDDYNGKNYVIGNYAFYGCTSLTSIEIPNSITSIGDHAFNGCNGLKEVHISDLASWCNIDFADLYANPLYYAKNLYLNGEKLTELVIPDGIVEIKDYTFHECTMLTSVVIGNSVTRIGDSAFEDCTGLTSIEIGNSVTSIGSSAFYGCSALTSVVIGNSVTSIEESAFASCSHLTSIVIPKSVTSIGKYAFSYCTQLNEIISLNPISPVLNRTFNYIGANGVLKVPKGSDYSSWMGTSEYYLGYYNWTVEDYEIDYSKEYFTIVALEDGLTVKLSRNASEYRIDNGEWISLAKNTTTPSINSGQKISFKITDPIITDGIGIFTVNKAFNVEGNIMSLHYGDNFEGKTDLSGKDNVFYGLFYNCTTLKNAENLILPATTLASSCYSGMFSSCTSLTTAPELPATTLVDNCYDSMFSICTSLTTAPELPATTLVDNCYVYMFDGCSKLNYIKMLATNVSAFMCLSDWVNGVASSGTFVKHKDATWDVRGTSGIPNGWEIITA